MSCGLSVCLCFQRCAGGQGQEQLESLQQENEALKAQMSRLSSQLIDVGTSARQSMLIVILFPSVTN